MIFNKLTYLPARVLAAGQVVHVHVRLAQALDGFAGVAPQAPGNRVGDDTEALSELVDEAEAELALDDGGSDKEHAGCFRGLVLSRQQGRAREAVGVVSERSNGASRDELRALAWA